MQWYVLICLIWLVLIGVLISLLFLGKYKESLSSNKGFMLLIVILLNITLLWPLIIFSHLLLPSMLLLCSTLVIIVWIFLMFYFLSTLEYFYIGLVLSSIALAYLTPFFIDLVVEISKKIGESKYTDEWLEKYKKLLNRINFRLITYVVLLIFYLIKNFDYFKSGGITNELLQISTEALLTFVIIDTIIEIIKKKN